MLSRLNSLKKRRCTVIMQVDNEPLGEDVSHPAAVLGSRSTLGGSLLLTSDPGCGQFAEVVAYLGGSD